jgi:hypothetical protein
LRTGSVFAVNVSVDSGLTAPSATAAAALSKAVSTSELIALPRTRLK